jgi:hypothetical protein
MVFATVMVAGSWLRGDQEDLDTTEPVTWQSPESIPDTPSAISYSDALALAPQLIAQFYSEEPVAYDQPTAAPTTVSQVEDAHDKNKQPTDEKAPERAAAVPPVAEDDAPAPPKSIKRRRNFSEQDLRKLLAWAPEIRSFNLTSMATLIQAYRDSFKFSKGDWNGALEPVILLQNRPDLTNLPVRSGSTTRLNRKGAAILQNLSKKLHWYVDTAVTRDTNDGRPDPTRLRDILREERRGQRPEWLRSEAVPVLLQLLMHEATPIREVLVEILSEIDGKAASTALAQRAVFDLSPQIRQAAIEALKSRPRSDYRQVFLLALRHPWAPAADHAAESLTALEDRDCVPALVGLLKKPDPTAPIALSGNRWVVKEMVRIEHRSNCLMCHPPAISGRDPVVGMVPGVSMTLPESSFRMPVMCKETGRVVVNPLLVRADVTFMRQDFSVRQPTVTKGTIPIEEHLRFDYLVRARPANRDELARTQSRSHNPASYEQREAVLFALRELTGQDAGPTTEAWQKLFPAAEVENQAGRLANSLIRSPGSQKERLLEQYKQGNGPVYTRALALAIPRLRGDYLTLARDILAERLAASPQALEAGLSDDDIEMRRAAVRACARTQAHTHIPQLIRLLEDADHGVSDAANAALQEMTGRTFGPATGKTKAQVVAAWNEWWDQ